MNEHHVTRETRTVEFKEQISDSFLKSVSAFANYSGGKIYFGITDDGKTIDIKNPEEYLLTIENKINSTIKPQPNYQLDLTDDNVIILTVKEGLFKPYKYRGKAFKRADTSTVEVDHLELNRLILGGSGLDYEALPAPV
ncbi:ATP-binding protein [Corynebacterium felinum]|uniref:HTH transcriptional regulator n=1 Tax=Corynebacterium felinum TaxID=131318 RepID=A0ABU2BCD1_9CORY|nr:ATP-binding protein [Corynebacterium felinum]MDF5821589.1 ATP-binding protein [Corynebacterium felinum]MDR7356250.1 putative HTH transcriptional regulator [Corynebacterium felinum]WJY95583.1 Divergent AAA domain protein [Corynebacterium felinum]